MNNKINLKPQDYYTQRNNKLEPEAACMPTSRAMFYCGNGIAFVNESDLQDDDYFMKILSSDEAFAFAHKKYPDLLADGYPPYEIHGLYHSYLDHKVVGHRVSDFRLDLTWGEIIERVLDGEVIMTSGAFPGLEGHAFCIIGAQLNHNIRLILADPWGDYHSSYRDSTGYGIYMDEDDFTSYVKPYTSRKWGHVLL
jgi:hypothetical protein